jgi:hypothetical protein
MGGSGPEPSRPFSSVGSPHPVETLSWRDDEFDKRVLNERGPVLAKFVPSGAASRVIPPRWALHCGAIAIYLCTVSLGLGARRSARRVRLAVACGAREL